MYYKKNMHLVSYDWIVYICNLTVEKLFGKRKGISDASHNVINYLNEKNSNTYNFANMT